MKDIWLKGDRCLGYSYRNGYLLFWLITKIEKREYIGNLKLAKERASCYWWRIAQEQRPRKIVTYSGSLPHAYNFGAK